MTAITMTRPTAQPVDSGAWSPLTLLCGGPVPDVVLRHGGWLPPAVAFGVVDLDLRPQLAWTSADGRTAHSANGCDHAVAATGEDVVTVEALLTLVAAGEATVCRCLYVDQNPAAPESLACWAWSITTHRDLTADPFPVSARVHQLRYLAGLPVLPDEEHRWFSDLCVAFAEQQVRELVGSAKYRADVVAQALAAEASAPETVQVLRSRGAWTPEVPTGLVDVDFSAGDVRDGCVADSDIEACYAQLVAGPQVWHQSSWQEYPEIGSRAATLVLPGDGDLRLVRSPVAFWSRVATTFGEVFLCEELPDRPVDVDDLRWAAENRPHGRDVRDLVAALAAARS